MGEGSQNCFGKATQQKSPTVITLPSAVFHLRPIKIGKKPPNPAYLKLFINLAKVQVSVRFQ
jgi:hypothetical protein